MSGLDSARAAIESLVDAVEVHRGNTNNVLQGMQAQIDDLTGKWAGTVVGGRSSPLRDQRLELIARFGREGGQGDFAQFAKASGVKAAMTIGSDPDGGFTVIPEMAPGVQVIPPNQSAMRGLATVVQVNSASYEVVLDPSIVSSGWVAETQSRPATDASDLVKRSYPVMEVYAMPAVSQSLIDDSAVDLGAYIVGAINTAFALKEGDAFINGDGVGKPRGLLTYSLDTADDSTRDFAKVQVVTTGSTTPSATQIADAVIELSMKLATPYRQNASWLMSRDTARIIRQLKDSTAGLLLWSNDGRLVTGEPDRLLGFPVYLDESMPAASANNLPVAFGDFRQGYLIADRIGIRIQRDPFTSRPYILFYAVKRVGAGILDSRAIKVLKYAS